jgi:hypothetical protein
MLETRHLRVSEQRPKEKQQRTSKGEFHSVVGQRNYLRERARARAVAAINRAGINAAKTTLHCAASPRFTPIALSALLAIQSQRDPPTN